MRRRVPARRSFRMPATACWRGRCVSRSHWPKPSVPSSPRRAASRAALRPAAVTPGLRPSS